MMRFSQLIAPAVAVSLSAGVLGAPGEVTMEELQIQAMEALRKTDAARSSSKCTLETATVRRDWESLTRPERLDYLEAVNCLWDMPTKNPEFSAAQNFFDDFVAVHLNQTNFIHQTANFLTWHRYFVWVWEDTLRTECGYKGALPYWNWFKYQEDLSQSPVFDGSDTSFGGDGEFFAHNGSIAGAGTVWIPSGKGGGCMQGGPFANRTINLGPIQPAMQGYPGIVKTQLDYHPRCLRRDLSPGASAIFTLSNLHNLTLGAASASIGAMQYEFQGGDGTLRMHGAGHYAMGGDGADVFTSLNDPAFYLHHAMVDRVYWVWQALHPEMADTVEGTLTYRNRNPYPSRNGTVDDVLDMGVLGKHRPIKDVLDTLGNTPLCYIYA